MTDEFSTHSFHSYFFFSWSWLQGGLLKSKYELFLYQHLICYSVCSFGKKSIYFCFECWAKKFLIRIKLHILKYSENGPFCCVNCTFSHLTTDIWFYNFKIHRFMVNHFKPKPFKNHSQSFNPLQIIRCWNCDHSTKLMNYETSTNLNRKKRKQICQEWAMYLAFNWNSVRTFDRFHR